jgi:hypothetical protein
MSNREWTSEPDRLSEHDLIEEYRRIKAELIAEAFEEADEATQPPDRQSGDPHGLDPQETREGVG